MPGQQATVGQFSTEVLLREYHDLIRSQIQGSMTNPERRRLAQVEHELDELDDRSEAARTMRQQMNATSAELDQLLRTVDALPDA